MKINILLTLVGFEVFDRVVVMVPTGVANSTETLITQIYRTGFEQFRYGPAAAQSFVLFLIIAVIAVIQFRFFNSDIEY